MEFNDRHIKINRKPFNGECIPEWLISLAFVDAYDICFSIDSWSYRNVGQTFHAVFIGKLGEHIVAEYFRNKGFRCHRPDYYTNNINGDSGDLMVEYNKRIYRFSVKTCMNYGMYLVESVKHFNNKGVYINNDNNIIFDRHYLVRVNQNLSNLNYNVSKQELWNTIKNLDWKAEISGFITHEDFKIVIEKQMIIYKGELNFSSDSYYIQSGDLRKLNK